ncbi:MAG: ABC transporter permease [Eubacteriaceae bacterium]|nr:ABC transporter permease [Eubacteriaceae bacterium]
MIGMGILETLYMIFVSTFISYLIGLPMGIILVACDNEGIKPLPALHKIIDIYVNITRSIPFIVLLVAVMPVTRFIAGTTVGTNAAIVPLVIGAAPFVARMIESSLREVSKGVIEASLAMGASPMQIIFKVLLPEAKPALLMGGAISVVTILSYTAMAGFVGGGGLGDIAIRYGYQRFQGDIMLVTVIILVILVQIFQEIGMMIVRKTDKRK